MAWDHESASGDRALWALPCIPACCQLVASFWAFRLRWGSPSLMGTRSARKRHRHKTAGSSRTATGHNRSAAEGAWTDVELCAGHELISGRGGSPSGRSRYVGLGNYASCETVTSGAARGQALRDPGGHGRGAHDSLVAPVPRGDVRATVSPIGSLREGRARGQKKERHKSERDQGYSQYNNDPRHVFRLLCRRLASRSPSVPSYHVQVTVRLAGGRRLVKKVLSSGVSWTLTV